MGNKLYLAYGSNLNIEQMAHRCPTARVVGVAALNGWTLRFRGAHENAVATVEPCEGKSIPVLVWEITPRDEKALDLYEGWPFLYRKETITVELEGKPVEAMIYIMNEGRPLGQPSCYYYNVILKGYNSAGFDADILKQGTRDSLPNEEDGDDE